VLNLHLERAVLATIDFAMAAETESFDTADLRPTSTSSSAGSAVDGAPLVRVDVADRVATLTLNRPEARNALNLALMYALWDAVGAAGATRTWTQ